MDGGDDRDPDWRMEILLTGEFLTSEWLISPIDTKSIWTTGKVTSDIYSFALLELD